MQPNPDHRDVPDSELVRWAQRKAEESAIYNGSYDDRELPYAELEYPDVKDVYKIISETNKFLSEEITTMSREDVLERLEEIVPVLVAAGVSGNEFCFSMADQVKKETFDLGQSPYAKLYWALFEYTKSDFYGESVIARGFTRELQNIIDQNPQMMGPAAMWDIAKNVLWQKEIDPAAKQSLYGSMTYALAFFDQSQYSSELLKQLDLNSIENYSETSHMLEAVKNFWSAGQDAYAYDKGVSSFFTNVLDKLEITPNSNFLLSLRARQLKSMLEKSEDFPNEIHEKVPFELSRGVMASTNRAEGLSVIPAESTTDATELVEMYLEIERQLVPPQWMVDEAIARGDSWVTWNPPQNLVRERSRIFSAMHSHATVPVGEYLSSDDATTDGERKQLVYDYEYLMSKPMREIIQKEFDFKLKDLSIREQLYFLNYLKLTTVGEVEMMKRFTATHGVTGMRTFLALEKGSKDLGDMIVVFGQYEELSKKVFEYYSELLDIAETAEQLVKQKTDCEGEVCIQLATQVRENILNRAQKDLEAAVRANDLGEIEEKIGNYVAEAKEYVAVLQELGAQSTEKILASELSNDDKSKMLALLQQNYDNAYTYDVDFKEKIKQSLEKSFANPQTEFHILRDESKVISFNRFDVVTDNTGRTANYFGSFNADAAYAGVGSVMLERTIKEQLEKCDVMYAHCDPTSDIAKKYIESGFVAKETETVAGKFSLEIWRTKDIAEHLRSKQMSADVLLEKAGKIEKDYMLVREAMPDDMFEELDRDLGYLLTRYFKHDNKTYAVFEIPSPTLWNQFKA